MIATTKLLAHESLMCGLRRLPIAGPAAEIIQGVSNRRELISLSTRVDSLEAGMSRWNIAMRDLVKTTISEAMEEFSKPKIDANALAQVIRELREMNDHDYHAALFEGLFKFSTHYEALRRQPENYGIVLNAENKFPRGAIPLFINLDKTRLVAIPPASVAFLLSSTGRINSEILTSEDVWAIPSPTFTSRTRRDYSRTLIYREDDVPKHVYLLAKSVGASVSTILVWSDFFRNSAQLDFSEDWPENSRKNISALRFIQDQLVAKLTPAEKVKGMLKNHWSNSR